MKKEEKKSETKKPEKMPRSVNLHVFESAHPLILIHVNVINGYKRVYTNKHA